MCTIPDICDAIGRKTLGQRLGVGRAAIANAVAEGKFPARWFKVVTDLCAEKGIDCPDELFNFAIPKSEDAA